MNTDLSKILALCTCYIKLFDYIYIVGKTTNVNNIGVLHKHCKLSTYVQFLQ